MGQRFNNFIRSRKTWIGITSAVALGAAFQTVSELSYQRGVAGQDNYATAAWKATKNETMYWVGQAGIQMENAGKEMRRMSWLQRQEP
jgi:hypothetical protein